MSAAPTAVSLEISAQVCDSTPLKSLDSVSEPLGPSISKDAQAHGLYAIEPGWLSPELEQREARRQAFDAGKRNAAASYLNNPMMEAIAFEIGFLRKLVEVMTEASKTLQWERDHWRAKFMDAVRVIRNPK